MTRIALITISLFLTASAYAQSGKESSPYLLQSANSITGAGTEGVLPENVTRISSSRGIPVATLTMETPQGNVQSITTSPIDPANCNIIISNMGVGNEIIGAGYDVRIETLDPSFQSEVRLGFFDNTSGTGVAFTPAVGVDSPGAGDFSSTGLVDLVGAGLDFEIGADGQLLIAAYESFDDAAVNPDADIFNLPVGGDFGLSFACTDQATCNAAFSDPANYSTSGQCAGFEFVEQIQLPESQPVPVNNFWALGLMILLLAGLGMVVIRRMF